MHCFSMDTERIYVLKLINDLFYTYISVLLEYMSVHQVPTPIRRGQRDHLKHPNPRKPISYPNTVTLLTLEPSTLHSVFQVEVSAAQSVQRHLLLNITLYMAIQINYILFETTSSRQSWRLKFCSYNPGGSKDTTPESCPLISAHKIACVPANTLNKIL